MKNHKGHNEDYLLKIKWALHSFPIQRWIMEIISVLIQRISQQEIKF